MAKRNLPPWIAAKSKYGNHRVEYDGIKFDSKKECRVYQKLLLMQHCGEVTKFDRQVTYKLAVSGVHVCSYRADFVVTFRDGRVEVWDAKGFKTKEYQLKKKLIKAVHGIDIVEV
ncbi:MAG: DUF1064 domain-containing protein [Chitinispirillales bacterium]|jgi:hypothetical protein|nr:DUF1064 domain-containing protein [Chitinispirillales bacterium]